MRAREKEREIENERVRMREIKKLIPQRRLILLFLINKITIMTVGMIMIIKRGKKEGNGLLS